MNSFSILQKVRYKYQPKLPKALSQDISNISVVVNGSGAAGIAVTKLLMSVGLKKVILCDRKGAIYEGREGMNNEKEEMSVISNIECKKGNNNENSYNCNVHYHTSYRCRLRRTGEINRTKGHMGVFDAF